MTHRNILQPMVSKKLHSLMDEQFYKEGVTNGDLLHLDCIPPDEIDTELSSLQFLINSWDWFQCVKGKFQQAKLSSKVFICDHTTYISISTKDPYSSFLSELSKLPRTWTEVYQSIPLKNRKPHQLSFQARLALYHDRIFTESELWPPTKSGQETTL